MNSTWLDTLVDTVLAITAVVIGVLALGIGAVAVAKVMAMLSRAL